MIMNDTYVSERDNIVGQLAVLNYRISTLSAEWKHECDPQIKMSLSIDGKKLETEKRELEKILKKLDDKLPFNYLNDEIFYLNDEIRLLRRDIQLLEYNMRRKDETIIELRNLLNEN